MMKNKSDKKKKPEWILYDVFEDDNHTDWVRLGVGYNNQDGSITVLNNVKPLRGFSGKLVIRPVE